MLQRTFFLLHTTLPILPIWLSYLMTTLRKSKGSELRAPLRVAMPRDLLLSSPLCSVRLPLPPLPSGTPGLNLGSELGNCRMLLALSIDSTSPPPLVIAIGPTLSFRGLSLIPSQEFALAKLLIQGLFFPAQTLMLFFGLSLTGTANQLSPLSLLGPPSSRK